RHAVRRNDGARAPFRNGRAAPGAGADAAPARHHGRQLLQRAASGDDDLSGHRDALGGQKHEARDAPLQRLRRSAAPHVRRLGPAATFTPAVQDLRTPRSRTWDLGLDYRFNATWSLHAGMLDRQGRNELILDPVLSSPTTGQLLLTASGKSSYLGGEIAMHFSAGDRADINVSYTRSRAHADLNTMANYFDTIMSPVLGRNEY